jgi:hypothetical protein
MQSPPLQPSPSSSSDLTRLHVLALQGAGLAELEQCLKEEEEQQAPATPAAVPSAAAAAAPATPAPTTKINAGLPHDPFFTALSIACSYGRTDTARHLLDLGADAKGKPNSYGPFLCASPSLGWRLLALLLAHGADASLLSPSGGSAFDRALDHNYFAVVKESQSAFDKTAALALVAGSPVRKSRDATAVALGVVQRAKKALSKGGDEEHEAWRKAMAAAAGAAAGATVDKSKTKDKQLMLAARLRDLARELGGRGERGAAAAAAAAAV